MPIPDLNCVYLDYDFTEEEKLLSQILTPLQQAYLQSIRARKATEKVSIPIPEDNTLDRSYWLRMATLEAEIQFVTMLFDNHMDATKKISARKTSESTRTDDPDQSGVNLAQRASNLVHKTQE
jgi:hypothetical protein